MSTTDPNTPNDIENLFHPVITDHENQSLIHIPTQEEIENTIKVMNSLKSLSLDGIRLPFHKKKANYKNAFHSSIETLFKIGLVLKECNTAFIKLIPKKQNAVSFNESVQ